eukprot:g17196.t1
MVCTPSALKRFKDVKLGDLVYCCVSGVSIDGRYLYLDRYDHDWDYFDHQLRPSSQPEVGAYGREHRFSTSMFSHDLDPLFLRGLPGLADQAVDAWDASAEDVGMDPEEKRTSHVESSVSHSLESLGEPILEDETRETNEAAILKTLRSNLLHRCTSIASDLTEHVAKVAASFSNGSVALLDFGPDVVAALSFPCSQREIEIKTSAITPNQRLCGTDEASPKHKQLLVGTEAGIATVWRMDRHLEDPWISAVGIGNQELFTGGADGSMCIWSQPGRSGDRLLRKIPAHGGAVTCVESAGPAQAFSAGEEQGFISWRGPWTMADGVCHSS